MLSYDCNKFTNLGKSSEWLLIFLPVMAMRKTRCAGLWMPVPSTDVISWPIYVCVLQCVSQQTLHCTVQDQFSRFDLQTLLSCYLVLDNVTGLEQSPCSPGKVPHLWKMLCISSLTHFPKSDLHSLAFDIGVQNSSRIPETSGWSLYAQETKSSVPSSSVSSLLMHGKRPCLCHSDHNLPP